MADRGGYDFMLFAHLPSGFLVPFLLLVLLPNLVCRACCPDRALTRIELLTVFAMGWAASMMPDLGVTRYMVSAIAAPAYFASPENRWDELILPHLPHWVYLSDYESARRFYEGLGPGQRIPWSVWVTPVFWWLCLFAALLLIGACIVVIFRRQWMEYERLRFPMAEAALRLIGESEEDRTREQPGLLRNRIFLAGFLVAFSAMAWNCAAYWGALPLLPIHPGARATLEIAPYFPGIPLYLNLYALAFAFFAPAEILFSLWFFQLFGVLEQGLLSRLGMFSTSGSVVQGGLTGMQYMGGVIVFAVWLVWIARRHLAAVWRAAWRPARDEDEARELFSYRWALIGLGGGSAFAVLWLYSAGLSIPVGLLFLVVMFTFYLVLARVVAESGLVMAELTVKPNYFTVGMIGTASLSMRDINVLGMANGFARNWRTFTMVGFSHIAWLKSRMGGHGRGLFAWIGLAIAVSAVLSVVSLVHSGHTVGAHNLYTQPGGLGTFFFGRTVVWATNVSQIGATEALFLLSGMLINGLVIAGRAFFTWWPFHPVGMAVGDVGGVVRNAFLPIFLAWLLQIVLIRIGGVRMYRAAQPFFTGVILGFLMGVALSLAVDEVFFPGTPHRTEWY